MRTFVLILATHGILGGVLGTLTMITFGLAAGANSSPEARMRKADHTANELSSVKFKWTA